MLRSLVGSEMCIRDSHDTVQFRAIFTSRKFDNWRKSLRKKLRYAQRMNFCLLYTSDAADDLLCVDLGGRRIIKKKKTQETEDEKSEK